MPSTTLLTESCVCMLTIAFMDTTPPEPSLTELLATIIENVQLIDDFFAKQGLLSLSFDVNAPT